MTPADEWNPEQRVFMAVLRAAGCADPAAVVRRDRLGATASGADLVPAVRALVASLGATLGELVDVLGVYDGGGE